jgi:hypothetical protein
MDTDLWKARHGRMDTERAVNLLFERTLDLKLETQALEIINVTLLGFLKRSGAVDQAQFSRYVDDVMQAFEKTKLGSELEQKIRTHIESLKNAGDHAVAPVFQVIEGGKREDDK